jgi:hypothetical protein
MRESGVELHEVINIHGSVRFERQKGRNRTISKRLEIVGSVEALQLCIKNKNSKKKYST